jgi:hypothetical protein
MPWMRTRTVTEMIADARARADREADDPLNGFVPDREVIRYIQKASQKLWAMLVEAYGTDYYWTQYNFTLAPGAVNGIGSYLDLPPDFFKLRGISTVLNNGLAIPLKPFTMFEREKFRSNPVLVWWGVEYRYKLEGTQVHIIPSAQGNVSMTMFYTPTCPFMGYGGAGALSVPASAIGSGAGGALQVSAPAHNLRTGQPVRWTLGAAGSPALPAGLRADTDYYVLAVDNDRFQLCASQANAMGQGNVTPAPIAFAGAGSGSNAVDCVFDGINGFDEFIVLDAAIAILGKEESDTARLERERAKIENDLRMMAEDRDSAFPGQVQDTQSLYWQINPTGRAY